MSHKHTDHSEMGPKIKVASECLEELGLKPATPKLVAVHVHNYDSATPCFFFIYIQVETFTFIETEVFHIFIPFEPITWHQTLPCYPHYCYI